MKKITKVISTLLVIMLAVVTTTVSTFAAEATSITVITPPVKTVYHEGIDSYENEVWCDPTGMVLEVTFDDGSTELIVVDEYSYVDMYVSDYVIGENEAVVGFYGTDDYDVYLETTCTVTVEESPVTSVEITKMPTKTEYDINEDVMTRENFSIDYLYESDPEMMDEMLGEMGMTFEEMKAFYEENPEYYDFIVEMVFADYEEILLVDTDGMEILVTFSDGSTTTITSDDNYITYNGEEFPVYIEQLEPTVTEGENVFVVDVIGTQAEFVVNVVSNEENTTEDEKEETITTEPDENEEDKDIVEDKENKDEEKEETTTKLSTDKDKENKEDKDDKEDDKTSENKNPVIPNTDGGVSVAAATVLALASGFGIALFPSKKEK